MSEANVHLSENRRLIYQQLGLLDYLQHRQLLQFRELPLHGELYPSQPQDPWILFIPGIGTYSELYCEMLHKLSLCGFNCLSIDLPGHGYSGGSRGSYRLDTLIPQLRRLIDQLEKDHCGPFGVFGCSIGSRIGLALAEQEPRVQALMCHTLFINEVPPDMFHQFGWQALSINRFFMPWAEVDFRSFIDIDNLLTHNPMGEFARVDERLVWQYPISTLDSVYNARSRITESELGIPSAIIVGERDQVLSPSYIRRLISSSRQPFDLFEVDDGCHMLPFEHIDTTVKTVADWFHRQAGFQPTES
ncbi:alpha/beta fold hydrolase [Motiliproteus sp.]|uniref:alpha/beta fold hydrolase n=1 Tax=Motiliproteus sp. TaxID=1898955 RepID=UPI003BAC7272